MLEGEMYAGIGYFGLAPPARAVTAALNHENDVAGKELNILSVFAVVKDSPTPFKDGHAEMRAWQVLGIKKIVLIVSVAVDSQKTQL
jgi:hypothetical protein